ncbi:ATP-binding cassette domain-containing protein [Motiliproteus sediminis]|uniref:ATP-binding cassette domain-containing protein n=1 Tax=Motiliproteus sediminis TaxID=1468178 RepID=UPI001AEF3BCC|nr:ATP-binding cassette domain-containing protein [Motiliproteus sediminis]
MSPPVANGTGQPLLQLSQHSLAYQGQTVLTDVTLTIATGEKVALIGESGAGKSTLLKLLRSQQPQQSAYCPQHLGLVQPLSVFHNIYMGRLNRYSCWHNLRNLIYPTAERMAEIGALAAELGIAGHLRHSVDRLSGGQQQRTALGRALYQQSPLFIGDEPVSSVDEYQADALLALINQRHSTVVVALHDQQLALKHYQRVIGLRAGRVVLDAPTDRLSSTELAAVYPQS